jgi:DNA-binding response OmpR family regulator
MFLLKTVPVAFLTARKTPEDVRTGLDAGGNDFIVKPFDPEKLLARVDHWMGRRISA